MSNPKVTVFTAIGHSAWNPAYHSTSTWAWLFQQQKPDITLSSPAPGSTTILPYGSNSVTFNGTATDKNGTALTGSSIQWISNLVGVVGTGTSATTTGATLGYGAHIIKMQATDNSYRDNKQTLNVTVPYTGAFQVNFNFEPPSPTSVPGGNWNTVIATQTVDYHMTGAVADAIDYNTGAKVGVSLSTTKNFSYYATDGINSTALYPSPVQIDSWSSQYNTGTGEVAIGGLNPSETYTFTIFGSSPTGGWGTALYAVNGSQVSINIVGNTTNLAQWTNVTPDATGTVYVDDINNGATAESNLNALIISTTGSSGTAPVFTSGHSGPPPLTATVGTAYSGYTYAATGTPTPTFTLATGSLPGGLTLNSTSGVLSGTPSAGTGGVYPNISVKAVNTAGSMTTSTFTMTVNQAPAFTDGPPPTSGTTGTAYQTFTYTASGYPASTFSLTSGAFPTGLTLNGTTGVLSGTPSVANTFTGIVTAMNGTTPNATQTFSIAVSQGNVAPTFTYSGSPAASVAVNTAYTAFTFSASGTPNPTYTLATGTLPTGMSLSTANGALSGTPTVTGVYSNLSVKAGNTQGNVTTGTFSITVTQAPAFTYSGGPATTVTVNTAYTAFTFSASGTPTPTYTLASGTLPTGMSLSSTTGVLSGTPTATGTSSGLSVKAGNIAGTVTTSTFTINVGSGGGGGGTVKTVMVCYAATTSIPSNWNVFSNSSYTNHAMTYIDGTTAPDLYSQTNVGSGNIQEGGATFTTAGGVAVGSGTTPAIVIPGGANGTPVDSLIFNTGTTTFTLSGLDTTGATSYTLTLYYTNSGARVVTYTLTADTSAQVSTVSLSSPSAGGPPFGSTVSLVNVIPTSGGVISFTMATGNSGDSANGYIGILEIDSSVTH